RLHNPAFARLWQLAPELLSQEPHVETVSSWSRSLHNDQPIWQRLRATITAIDVRSPIAGRLERADGSLVDCASTPLPDGATLVTFQDVTDTVNVERALRERNEALEAADKLKIDFVHHVSYELRSPLTASRMPSCFRSPIAVPAFRRKYRARCSIGSKPTPSAHGIGAPVSDSRWCARSSSCTAGPCDWSRLQVAARR